MDRTQNRVRAGAGARAGAEAQTDIGMGQTAKDTTLSFLPQRIAPLPRCPCNLLVFRLCWAACPCLLLLPHKSLSRQLIYSYAPAFASCKSELLQVPAEKKLKKTKEKRNEVEKKAAAAMKRKSKNHWKVCSDYCILCFWEMWIDKLRIDCLLNWE